MEVVGEDGSKTRIKPGQTQELGRSHGLDSSDKTSSRRQVSFFVPRAADSREIVARFEVVGKNPIYVSRGDGVRVFRRFERGEMGDGDVFSVSAKNPVWYALRKTEDGDGGEGVRRNVSESKLAGSLESGFGFEGAEDLEQVGVDVSDVDPVKEFGFLVIGHEFDSYPKKMVRDIKNWDWFLDEAPKDNDEDDYEDKKGNKSMRSKRKKFNDNDDDEWTGESEDDKVLIEKSRKAYKPKYVTRSKDRGRLSKNGTSSSKSSVGKKTTRDLDDEEDGDEDEGDETLGGFIVDDENLDEEEEDDDEEEELVDEFEEDENE